ncbi:MAG: DoxX family membrane protein [Rhodothermaceae bacterium]|nr:DoxX family membrane protein [Rhodothermaceae bacterium]
MEPLARWQTWLDAHRAEALDLVRIYLGIGLFVRGLYFLTNSEAYFALMPEAGPGFLVSGTLLHYVALAHLGGGLLLTVGLLTRIAALVQVPILLGAVVFVHGTEGLLGGDQSFELAAMVLFLLVLFTLWGSGPWSLDDYLARRAATEQEDEAALIAANVQRLRERAQMETDQEHAVVVSGEATPTASGPIHYLDTEAECSCGNDIHHPDVVVERHYSFPGVLPFVAGVTATPARVSFRCSSCGEVFAETTDPALLQQYRYEEHPGPTS